MKAKANLVEQADRSPAIDSHGHSLTMRAITKSFGATRVLSDISVEIAQGEFLSLLGPSGCGKTTLLRIVAGLESADSGLVLKNGRDITAIPPHKRDYGIVFQSYALFPNLSVFENVAYGLRSRKVKPSHIRERVMATLEMVRLQDHHSRAPAQLSGGQQQRVALARALVLKPSLLLLDEPLSALDAKVRLELRRQIRSLHDELGLTTIMVTHDQDEALTMSDRIAVMHGGVITQCAPPRELYESPVDPFTAHFIGTMNFIPAHLIPPRHDRKETVYAVRPEHIALAYQSEPSALEAVVEDIEFRGAFYRVYARIAENAQVTVDTPAASFSQHQTPVGSTVWLRIPEQLHVAFADEAAL